MDDPRALRRLQCRASHERFRCQSLSPLSMIAPRANIAKLVRSSSFMSSHLHRGAFIQANVLWEILREKYPTILRMRELSVAGLLSPKRGV